MRPDTNHDSVSDAEGIGSRVTAEVPGSNHEGGELAYPLSQAFGAALENPDLIVACFIGALLRDVLRRNAEARTFRSAKSRAVRGSS